MLDDIGDGHRRRTFKASPPSISIPRSGRRNRLLSRYFICQTPAALGGQYPRLLRRVIGYECPELVIQTSRVYSHTILSRRDQLSFDERYAVEGEEVARAEGSLGSDKTSPTVL